MSTKIVHKVIRDFLLDPKAGVLVMRGRWGVGKTYFWQACVHEFGNECSRDHYSYVSLFGASSIKQLQLSAIIGSVEIAQARDPGLPLGGSEVVRTGLSRAVKEFIGSSGGISGLWGNIATIGIDSIAPHMVSGRLICLDDIERIPESGPQLEEIMGFVTILKEEKNCKVVLIFNDERMSETASEVYRRYREKVVDIEVLFEPTTQEAAELAVPADHPHAALIRARLEILGITNIRMIRKILANVAIVQPLMALLDKPTAEANIAMTVLLTWMEYDQSEEHPSLEFLKKWQSYAWLMEEANAKKKKSPEEATDAERDRRKRWGELLQRYGILSFDNCDAALSRVIERGYAEDSGLAEEFAQLAKEVGAAKAEEEFGRAWRLYHDSLNDDTGEIMRIVDNTFNAAAPRTSPGNADATIRLLRSLGNDALADDLIDRYIRIRGHETRLFDSNEWDGGSNIEDARFAEAAARHFATIYVRPTLREVLVELSKMRGYSAEQIAVLMDAKVDDFYAIFKETGRGYSSMVKACLQFASDPAKNQIFERATSALKRIAGESHINRLRIVNLFGVTPDE